MGIIRDSLDEEPSSEELQRMRRDALKTLREESEDVTNLIPQKDEHPETATLATQPKGSKGSSQ